MSVIQDMRLDDPDKGREEFSEVRCSKPARNRYGLAYGDGAMAETVTIVTALAAFVARNCCERLRLATFRLRENFGVFGHSMSIHSREDPF
jgi:hypothetical protein